MPQHTVHLLAALFNPAVRRTEPGNTSFTFLTFNRFNVFWGFFGNGEIQSSKNVYIKWEYVHELYFLL